MNESRLSPPAQPNQSPPRPLQVQPQATDYQYLFSHYTRLLWRWKWFIVAAATTVAVAAFTAIVRTMPMVPEGAAVVLIGMDQPSTSNSDVVPDFSQPTGTKVELIRSRGFLSDIVQKQALQLVIDKGGRYDLFDSCAVDSAALPGAYELAVSASDRNSYTITFSNKKLGIQGRVVQSGAIASSDEIRFAGVYLRLAPGFARAPYSVSFGIVPIRAAVEALLKNLTIKPPEPRADRLHMSVSLAGRDYELIARTVNTMADAYVERSLAIRNRRVRVAGDVLEKQLSTVTQQLAVSEGALRNFLNAHPQVGLSTQTQQSVSELMSVRTGTLDIDNQITDALNLQGQYGGAADDISRQQATNEILLFLSSRNSTKAAVLIGDFNRSVQERNALEQTYAPDHPTAVQKRAELKTKIDGIGSQALQSLDEFIARSRQQRQARKTGEDRIVQQLGALPNLERQLADLQARQQIDAQLYSSILTRLNETKVANAAEVADVFVMDYAVPPLMQSRLLILARFLGIALALGLAAGLGPVLAIDYFDPTARSEQEAQRKTTLPIIAGIPTFNPAKKPRLGKGRKPPPGAPPAKNSPRVPSMLPTIDTGPDYAGEQFRSLRTKVMLSLHNDPRHGIIITSLNPNEGKSTIAANLAVTMAQNGFRTILIDGDMRRGGLHEQLGMQQGPGLSECLADKQPLTAESVKGLMQTCSVDKLSFVGCGAHVAQPLEMFASAKAKALASALGKVYDIIIVDTPPLAVASDAVAVQESFGRYLIVARAGKTNLAELQRKLNEFPSVKNAIIGIVLNEAEMESSRQQKYYSYYSSAKHVGA